MKYKRLRISTELLFSLFTAGPHPGRAYAITADAVPPDARLVHVRHSWPNDVEILISSETFAEITHGQEIPLLEPTFQDLR